MNGPPCSECRRPLIRTDAFFEAAQCTSCIMKRMRNRIDTLEADAKDHGAEQSRLRTQRDEAREHAATRTLTDANHLLYIIRDVIPVEHSKDGLLTFRFGNGTRLAFGCGPSGRLNFVSIQQGPDVPEIKSDAHHSKADATR